MTPCRICGAPVTRTFCDLGESPLANAYLLPAEDAIRAERAFPLHARVCDVCFLVQLEIFETPEKIFGEYAYLSSYSVSWLEHSRRYVDLIVSRLHLDESSLVVEVASNDGYLLQYFVERGIPVLGIEPAENVAALARKRGIRTDARFFGLRAARELVEEHGPADLLVANNVIAHVPDLHDFIAGIAAMLSSRGMATIEFPHLLKLIGDGLFDTIYHEHLSYFSLHSIARALSAHALAVVDLEELPTHGGSLRLFVQHSAGAGTSRLDEFREREIRGGLLETRTYDRFQSIAERKRVEVLKFFRDARDDGARVVCYGAPAKGNTLLNFCGITARDVPYTVDKNPQKQGRLLPGSHIPISPPERIADDRPDIVFILPWNLRNEIVAEVGFIRHWGGRFAVAMPRLEVF